MDKDTDNVGKVMFGLPVLDKAGAEEAADLVIINTAETYWDVIYSRIRDMKIPVYYLNGEKAEQKEDDSTENPFRELSFLQMEAETEKAEVISFDFFDTLFVRSVCNPQDIFRLMEKEAGIPFLQMRDRAKKLVRENYSLDELYRQMELLEKMPQGQLEPLRNRDSVRERTAGSPRAIAALPETLTGAGERGLYHQRYIFAHGLLYGCPEGLWNCCLR